MELPATREAGSRRLLVFLFRLLRSLTPARARLCTEPEGTKPVDQRLLEKLFVISFPNFQTVRTASSQKQLSLQRCSRRFQSRSCGPSLEP